MDDPPKLGFAIQAVQSIGFIRLTSYHWAALLMDAKDSLEKGECDRVRVQFTCVAHDLTQQKWDNRVAWASGSGFEGSDQRSFKDLGGRVPFIKKGFCGKDLNGAQVWSIPRKCGESFEVDLPTIQSLEASKCGDMMKKVTEKYNDPFQFFARELFSQDP
jgi:hypothetical protein